VLTGIQYVQHAAQRHIQHQFGFVVEVLRTLQIGEMDDGLCSRHRPSHISRITNVPTKESAVYALQTLGTSTRHVIQYGDVVILPNQAFHQGRADEPRSPSTQITHIALHRT
jgi:hypothetical protein